ncbi:hypothetical protein ABZ508_33335 [Streptomyces lavendulocolor]|uniref:Uncharacterized protein n=1 Tax=Streptomyces lavendulocolor TaxID=67316 RepID=A0ABV2WFX0_9ACTN
MPRIRLAYWYKDHLPGDEVEVEDEEFRNLSRDGRVAEVLTEPAAEDVPVVETEAPAQPAPEVETAGEQAPAESPGRKRR